MALIKCPECDNKISDKADSCPKCGYELHKVSNEKVIMEGLIKKIKKMDIGIYLYLLF